VTWSVAGYAAIPAIVMLVSAATSLVRAPGAMVQSAILHLAAGVIFAVVAVEFLPDLVHRHEVLETGVGFVAGAALMMAIRAWSEAREDDGEGAAGLPVAFLFATGVDLAIDGLMLGIGFAAGAQQGVLLTIGLAIELAALGCAATATLARRGFASREVVGWIVLLAATFFASALGGSALLALLSSRLLAVLLAFGSAALLFLVTEELLTEAHEVEETPLLTAAFFAGFLALFLLELTQR
jgi:ZIP family zinc transporter